MTRRWYRVFLFIIGFSILLAGEAYADTFEFLSFTPPAGWTKAATADGMTYVRPSGVGLVYFYNSYATNLPAEDEFAQMWRSRVSQSVPGTPPQPQVQRDAEFSVAVGSRQVDARGTLTTIALAVFVGRGRATGVLTMAAGEETLREVTTFLNSLDIAKAAAAVPGSGELDVDFQVPAGYTTVRDSGVVVFKPISLDRNTACIYGLSPSRPTRGDLERDAQAALLEPLPGWQVQSNHFNAMRGVSGGGWRYYWLRAEAQKLDGSSYKYFTAMSMAFENGPGKAGIFWGFGELGPCMADDAAFLRIFFSLRPRGSTSDGGKALSNDLLGLWRDTQAQGMAQYKFLPNGRYLHGLGTSTTFGNLETRTGSVGDGRYGLSNADLTLTPDARGRGISKYRIRVYDEFQGTVWRRTLSLWNESSNPPLQTHYLKVEER